MRKLISIKVFLALILFCLSFNAHSQYGVIEMKDGEQFEMASPDLNIEGDKLRYFKEKWERKASVMGFGAKKLRQEYLDKSRLINISDIHKVHAGGEILVGSKSIINFIGIRYIKVKGKYQEFYVIIEGECSLLIIPEDGNALYSYYVQKENEEPYQLHRAGTGLGAKFKKKSKKYFADCEPAMIYIQSDLKKSTLSELVEIYNENCAN